MKKIFYMAVGPGFAIDLLADNFDDAMVEFNRLASLPDDNEDSLDPGVYQIAIKVMR